MYEVTIKGKEDRVTKSNVLAVTLQHLMDARQWSQGRLAHESGIPQPTISRILGGASTAERG